MAFKASGQPSRINIHIDTAASYAAIAANEAHEGNAEDGDGWTSVPSSLSSQMSIGSSVGSLSTETTVEMHPPDTTVEDGEPTHATVIGDGFLLLSTLPSTGGGGTASTFASVPAVALAPAALAAGLAPVVAPIPAFVAAPTSAPSATVAPASPLVAVPAPAPTAPR